jgi:HK97 family phage major capsid protein
MDYRSRALALNAERLNVVEQLRTELDATAGRERSEEEAAKIARMDARINDIDAEVREIVERDQREREAAALREGSMHLFGEAPVVAAERSAEDLFRNWAMSRNAGSLEVNITAARMERELLRQGASPDEIRAIAWDTGTSGSLVPVTLARSLYAYMEASIAMFRAPTTKITTASGEKMQFPRVLAHGIATQVKAQGTALAGSDPTFSQMELDAYKYGQLVYIANEVLSDSGVDIAGFLGQNMGRALGRKIDTDLVVGGGSGAPNGIITAIGSIVGTGGTLLTPTVEKLIDAQYAINDEYRNASSAAWLMNDSTAGTLRKLRDGGGGTVGAFLWEASLFNGIENDRPDRLLGKPVYTDPNVSAAGSANFTVAFGDLSAYYVRQVGNPVIERDDSVKFAEDQAAFRAKWRVDGDLIDVNAAVKIRQVP